MASYELPVLKISTGQLTRDQVIARLANIDEIIALYEAAMITGGSEASIVEYELDTGQTKQRVKQSEPTQLASSLNNLQNFRDKMAAKLSPRNVRLMPIDSFKNC
jgi:hypothetical protein